MIKDFSILLSTLNFFSFNISNIFYLEIDKSSHSFLSFITLCEQDNKISDLFKSKILSKESELKISNLNLDSKEAIEKKSQIATDALSYVLSKKATSSTEYILIFCKEHSITPQIMDSSIIELLRSHKSKLNISIY